MTADVTECVALGAFACWEGKGIGCRASPDPGDPAVYA